MEDILHALTVWVTVTTGMPAAPEPPAIRFMPADEIAEAHYGRPLSVQNDDVMAAYDEATATIMLRTEWKGHDVADLSVLVHELVHHLQHASGTTFLCAEEQEALPYAVQEKYLGQFNENLESVFGIDKLTLKLKTTCIPY